MAKEKDLRLRIHLTNGETVKLIYSTRWETILSGKMIHCFYQDEDCDDEHEKIEATFVTENVAYIDYYDWASGF